MRANSQVSEKVVEKLRKERGEGFYVVVAGINPTPLAGMHSLLGVTLVTWWHRLGVIDWVSSTGVILAVINWCSDCKITREKSANPFRWERASPPPPSASRRPWART
jgi:hypothetical protein